MNIAAVTVSTKTDRSKIDWAGVDTGAKMFVGLRDIPTRVDFRRIRALCLGETISAYMSPKPFFSTPASMDWVCAMYGNTYGSRMSAGTDTNVERATGRPVSAEERPD
jgi:hypothetical protein